MRETDIDRMMFNYHLVRHAQRERALGVKYWPLGYRGNDKFHFIEDGGFAVRAGVNNYACLPLGVSVVFQPYSSGVNNVSCWVESDCWPDDFGPAIWVQSVDLDEIFRLTQRDHELALPVTERFRVVRIPPWQHGPSMSVGDVVATNCGGNLIELSRCEGGGWSTIETIKRRY